ncbi:MAG TPA: hypothetical protein VMY35_06155 [Phycisphaerae bacterium]|nr:hypothetical protein [Phycisphaerae bacterium]
MKRFLIGLLALAATAAVVVPAFAAGTGRRYYYFTVTNQFGETITDALTATVYAAGGSSETVYTDPGGVTDAATAHTSFETGVIAFWTDEASVDLKVAHDANGNAVKMVSLTVTDHKFMLPLATNLLTGTTTYTGTVNGVASAWTGTMTLGVDATGVDFQLYGDTTLNSMLWDYSDDRLELTAADILLDDDSDLIFGTGSDFVIDCAVAKTLLFTPAGVDELYSVNLGSDQAGIDLALFGTTASTTALWDADADLLQFDGGDVWLKDDDILLFGDTASGDAQIQWDADGNNNLQITGAAVFDSAVAFDGAVTLGDTVDTDVITITGTIAGLSPFVLEGTASANELTITIENPTADNTMTISDDTGNFAYSPGGNVAIVADDLVMVTTHSHISKTTGADAEALSLADGNPGQILSICLVSDGNGAGTLTPTTMSGFGTIVFEDVGDVATLMFVDDSVGWIILGTAGVAAPPVTTAP